jgi:putative tricarboxylic transport membrane protein
VSEHQKPNPGTEDGGTPSSTIHRGEILVTAVILAVCGFLYWQTTIFAAPPSMLGDYMLPQDFPRLLIWGIALLSLLLPLEESLLAKSDETPTDGDEEGPLQPIAYVTTAFMIATVFVMPWLGTLITVFLISAVMPILWGERRKLALVLFAVLTPLSIYVLFEVFFRVRLIPGLLRPLYY